MQTRDIVVQVIFRHQLWGKQISAEKHDRIKILKIFISVSLVDQCFSHSGKIAVTYLIFILFHWLRKMRSIPPRIKRILKLKNAPVQQ